MTPRTAALLLAALTAAVFSGALGVAFVLDDMTDIVGNVSAHWATWWERLPAMNRPLTKLTYALNDAAHGPWAAGYAAVNVLIHAGAAALAFVLARRAFAGAPAATLYAAAAVGLWALHPALTESVTYLSGRSMVLSAALMLGALVTSTGRRPLPVLAFGCALLAPLARETALVLPLILLWWQWAVGAKSPGRLRRAMPLWLGTGAAALLLAAMPRHRDLVDFSFDMRGPLEALRGNVQAASEVLAYWFTPWRVTLQPDAPLEYFWREPQTLLRVAGFALAAALCLVFRRRAPAFAFGLGLALIALLPTNSIIWRVDPVSLKPLYLAGLGLSIALIDVLRRLMAQRALLAIGAAGALALAVMTVQRNALFADPVALFADGVEKTPENARAWRSYGSALMAAERYDEATVALERALELQPHDERAMNLLDVLATIRNMEHRGGAP